MDEKAETQGKVTAIRGPVIVTAELPRQLRLFVDALGHRVVVDEALAPQQVQARFGVAGRRARAVLVEMPDTRIGAWLVEFDPPEQTVIRVGGVGYACDALKMIDFFTTDRLFSEMQSSSGPVSDFEPVRHFYEQVLGVSMGLRYEFESDSFSKMVGTAQTTRIRANNYGRVVEDVMLGIIHYGLPPGSFDSLRARAAAESWPGRRTARGDGNRRAAGALRGGGG